MHVPEIIKIKEHLDKLKKEGLIKEWDLPYENLLTRISSAIVFLTPESDKDGSVNKIWRELEKHSNFSQRLNDEKKLSKLQFRVTFSEEEKQENAQREVKLS